MKPARIGRDGQMGLKVFWDDGHVSTYTLQALRKSCPCAGCKTGQASAGNTALLPVLNPGENELSGIEPIGSYALQLKWKDGHKTGIYSYDYLRRLCECAECFD